MSTNFGNNIHEHISIKLLQAWGAGVSDSSRKKSRWTFKRKQVAWKWTLFVSRAAMKNLTRRSIWYRLPCMKPWLFRIAFTLSVLAAVLAGYCIGPEGAWNSRFVHILNGTNSFTP